MYKEMYFSMAAAVADALDQLDALNLGAARQILQQAMARSEEIFLAAGDPETP